MSETLFRVTKLNTENYTLAVDKSTDRVRRMFGEIADHYDFLNHFLSLSIDRWWRRRTVRTVRPKGDDPILDVCTGTGDLVLAYDRAARGKNCIVGLDFCHRMLQIGQKKVERRKAG
ncbi:MAG: class I SAM-dependent methyltransferase, partial [Planctomycetia bacterium]